MRKFLFLLVLLTAGVVQSQETGAIMGTITDGASNNDPLLFANISIKGTAMETTTDEYGVFVFENLKSGSYTLVCSFIGYESQEIKTKVASKNITHILGSLKASTFDLSELKATAGLSSSNSTEGDHKTTSQNQQ